MRLYGYGYAAPAISRHATEAAAMYACVNASDYHPDGCYGIEEYDGAPAGSKYTARHAGGNVVRSRRGEVCLQLDLRLSCGCAFRAKHH